MELPEVLEKASQGHTERLRQLPDSVDADVALATLNAANVVSVKSCARRQLFLGDLQLAPQVAHLAPDGSRKVHPHEVIVGTLTTIGLHTMVFMAPPRRREARARSCGWLLAGQANRQDDHRRAGRANATGEGFRRVQQHLTPGTKPTRHVRDRDDFPLRRFLTCARCQRAISGSWSKGRNGRYAYYHCPKCRGVRCRRETTEATFLAHLEALKPAGAYLRLFRAVVVDVWRAEQDKARDLRKLRTARVAELQERPERLEEAFIYARSISQAVNQKQGDRVQQELTDAELHLDEARAQQWDVEGIVAFAEHLIANLAALWLDANLQQRQAIQRSIFPEGLPFDGQQFGTAATCLAFKHLRDSEPVAEDLASPTGFEPVF